MNTHSNNQQTVPILDCIIIGAGPAGIGSAIFLKRFNKNILLISKNIGGAINTSSKIDNYPGFFNIDGQTLQKAMIDHLSYLQVDYIQDTVYRMEKYVENNNIYFNVYTHSKVFQSKCIILSMGCTYRQLNDSVRNLNKFKNEIKFCATCDGFFYQNQDLLVVGGGNVALHNTLVLSDIANNVTVLNKHNEFKNADKILLQQCVEKNNVKFIYGGNINGLYGDDLIESASYLDEEGIEYSIAVNGVFVSIGQGVAMIENNFTHLQQHDNGEIIINNDFSTHEEGVFALGDVVRRIKQYAIAIGDGCATAYTVRDYLEGKKY